MPFQSLRSRFTTNLESHQIDDDYTINSLGTISDSDTQQQPMPIRNSVFHSRQQSISQPIDLYDPFEIVPSYETSQLLHSQIITPQQQPPNQQQQIAEDQLSESSRSRLYTPIPSLPIPRTQSTISMSQTNSTDSSLTSSPQLRNNNTQQPRNKKKITSIKQLGLKFLNARQHFLLAFCRDVSLIPPLISLIQSWKRCCYNPDNIGHDLNNQGLTSARNLEHFLTGIWCLVSSYLSYSILDSLLVRWIVTYSTSAAIVRVLSMSTIMITCEFYLVSTFSANGYKYGLHIWILISCLLTLTYTVQNFVTSNLQLTNNNSNGNPIKKKNRKQKRFFDFYNIVVFAVVPVGLASFVTMIGLLRSLLILRIDIDQTLKDLNTKI
ncbi:unnamed protein product [Candida verbasci]|uniref:N-glycosylation protein EOS1 n=1 Tax=Candida verbasci TaxID=1227364 RepID=A0A9W4TSU1_9ASCO|nr:unnamed protein product [Candida verbasci]